MARSTQRKSTCPPTKNNTKTNHHNCNILYFCAKSFQILNSDNTAENESERRTTHRSASPQVIKLIYFELLQLCFFL